MAEHFSPAEVADLLESAMAIIRAEVEALPKEIHVWHPEPDDWSINEIIGHLIEAERRGLRGADQDPPRHRRIPSSRAGTRTRSRGDGATT